VTEGYTAPTCQCGHKVGEHRSAGTSWPHPPRFGVCLVNGCACREFRDFTAQVDALSRAATTPAPDA